MSAKVTEKKSVLLKTVQLDPKVSVNLYDSGSIQVVYNGYSPCRRATITPEAIGALITASVQNKLADLAEDSIALKAAKPAKQEVKTARPVDKMNDAEWAEFQDFKAFKAERARQAALA